jgi:hypothetical protein
VNFILLKANLAPFIARSVYRNIELTTWQQAYTFFAMANASGSPTRFYSPTKLVKNIQLSFGLAFHPAPGTPVGERRIQIQRHMQLMDNLQFGLKYFTKLISLNVFISPATEDPF